jgi:hypothetical protein
VLSPLSQGLRPIYDQIGATDVAGHVGCQEQHCLGDLVGIARAPQAGISVVSIWAKPLLFSVTKLSWERGVANDLREWADSRG